MSAHRVRAARVIPSAPSSEEQLRAIVAVLVAASIAVLLRAVAAVGSASPGPPNRSGPDRTDGGEKRP